MACPQQCLRLRRLLGRDILRKQDTRFLKHLARRCDKNSRCLRRRYAGLAEAFLQGLGWLVEQAQDQRLGIDRIDLAARKDIGSPSTSDWA